MVQVQILGTAWRAPEAVPQAFKTCRGRGRELVLQITSLVPDPRHLGRSVFERRNRPAQNLSAVFSFAALQEDDPPHRVVLLLFTNREGPSMTDEQLIQIVAAGGPDADAAWLTLDNYYRPRLRSFILGKLREPQTADELAAETLSRAWAAAHLWRPLACWSTYLFTIALNQIRTEARRRSRLIGHLQIDTVGSDDEAPLDPPDPEADPSRLVEERELHAVLNAIPEPYRTTLQLRAASLSYDEIQAATGAHTLGTVRSRIYRGRAMLRGALAA